MKRALAILTLVATLFPSGCKNDQPRTREIIIEPDLSASIDKQSQQQMFAAIKDATLHLRRGDNLTIIPITGDAEADLQGQILHYEVASIEKREAYDGDLRKLSAQVANDLYRLSAEAAAHPGTHTDILGSVRVALQTFSTESTDKQLLILSDFIQDDDQFRFMTDRRLESKDSAKTLACGLEKDTTVPVSTRVVMGRLRSADFDRLPIKRRLAIDAFWGRLLAPATVEPDGIFCLRRLLDGYTPTNK